VYFYTLGRDLFYAGGEVLQKWSKRMGLGRRTGIDLPNESPGQIPGRTWRADINDQERRCRKRTGRDYCGYALEIRPYNVGDNVNLAIGQGEIAASPLQIATAYATLATGGRVPRPHIGLDVQDASGRLVQEIDPGSTRKVKIEAAWRQALMDGLAGAAQSDGGTSAGVFSGWPHSRLPVFGKTGTAQVPFQGAIVDQSWYVAYVPHPTKPVVVAATIERGGFGADRAAPLVRRMLAKWFDLPNRLARPSAESSTRQAAD
jgi:penicillin-binding protein 2